jgi:hypothetical protein
LINRYSIVIHKISNQESYSFDSAEKESDPSSVPTNAELEPKVAVSGIVLCDNGMKANANAEIRES